jgi:hypothetical protein
MKLSFPMVLGGCGTVTFRLPFVRVRVRVGVRDMNGVGVGDRFRDTLSVRVRYSPHMVVGLEISSGFRQLINSLTFSLSKSLFYIRFYQ